MCIGFLYGCFSHVEAATWQYTCRVTQAGSGFRNGTIPVSFTFLHAHLYRNAFHDLWKAAWGITSIVDCSYSSLSPGHDWGKYLAKKSVLFACCLETVWKNCVSCVFKWNLFSACWNCWSNWQKKTLNQAFLSFLLRTFARFAKLNRPSADMTDFTREPNTGSKYLGRNLLCKIFSRTLLAFLAMSFSSCRFVWFLSVNRTTTQNAMHM